MHQVWSATVNAALAERGLSFFAGYVWGRAAVLGEVEPLVAASAFAVFEPGVIAAMIEEGRAAISRDEIVGLLDERTIESFRRALGLEDGSTPDELAQAASVLRRAVESADGTGRPLFCGVRALGWPTDPIGQLWRACHALREHRGDSHTASFVAAGFDPVAMNILTELWVGYPYGAYSTSRRWSQGQTATALDRLRGDGLLQGSGPSDWQLSADGLALRDAIEAATDRAQGSVVDALGADLDTVVATVAHCSERCLAAGAFPPDVRKRAAG